MKPYTEKILSENKRVRKFSSDVDPMMLEWHQDKRNRVVKVLEGTGWKFQLDDNLPVTVPQILKLTLLNTSDAADE